VAELMGRSLGWSSGLRISTGHRGMVLRRHHGGKGGLWVADGEELGWRWLPAAAQRSPGAAEQSKGGG